MIGEGPIQGGWNVIAQKRLKSTYFATIASGTTSGTITKPASQKATLVMDEWGTDTDALLSTMDGGKPTFKSPVNSSGDPITTTFDTNGNFVFSDSPSPAADTALVYVYTCKLRDLNSSECLWESELLPELFEGPASALNNEVPVFDGTTGKKIKAGTGFIITANLMQAADKALLLSGTTGGTPVSGAGTRMMWVPEKCAFRVGIVTGTQWDSANLGSWSTAFGYNGIASGMVSVHFGYGGVASSMYSTHFGANGVVSGSSATHFGAGGVASGTSATHFGDYGVASGGYSTHFGNNGVASGSYSAHFGYGGTASGSYSICCGGRGEASGLYSAHFGYKGKAGSHAVHFGKQGEALGRYSAHFGERGKTEGDYSWVGGKYMQLSATADRSFAFGYHTSAVALTQPNTFYIFPGGTAGKVAVGTTTPAVSAIMDLTSTIGALLLPRMTTVQKNALTAVNGMLLYDSTLNQIQTYENGAWRQI